MEKVAKWSRKVARGSVAKLSASSVAMRVQLRLAILVHILMVIPLLHLCFRCCIGFHGSAASECIYRKWIIYLTGWLNASIQGLGRPWCVSVDLAPERVQSIRHGTWILPAVKRGTPNPPKPKPAPFDFWGKTFIIPLGGSWTSALRR